MHGADETFIDERRGVAAQYAADDTWRGLMRRRGIAARYLSCCSTPARELLTCFSCCVGWGGFSLTLPCGCAPGRDGAIVSSRWSSSAAVMALCHRARACPSVLQVRLVLVEVGAAPAENQRNGVAVLEALFGQPDRLQPRVLWVASP